MAKRKKAQPWDAVFRRVRVARSPKVIYVPPATDSQLDEVETQIGSRLPTGYREFMKRLGPGCLDEFVYLTPVLPLEKKRFYAQSLSGETEERRQWLGDLGQYRNSEWLSRLVYFAGQVNGGGVYAWDPGDVTHKNPYECRIHCIERLGEEELVFVGRSFAEFLRRIASDVRLWMELEPAVNPPTSITFNPIPLRNKKTPPKPDVRIWLAWNNHTARDLALAIRDHGHTDAFPILADALQEAGCTNADLLDSCRTGDPDIDGKWVLQVLLGKS